MAMYNPPHPGEFIKDIYLIPHGITSRQAANNLGVSPSTFTRLIKGESNISPDMALRLSKVFGRSPESWLAMQDSFSLWHSKQTLDLSNLVKFKLAG